MPAHQKCEKRAARIAQLSGLGVPIVQVAEITDIGLETLYKYYHKDWLQGKARASEGIGLTLYQQAMAGNTAALIWWTKSQMGWKDSSRQIEITGADGGPIKIEKIERVVVDSVVPLLDSDDEEEAENGEE